jgi:phosphoglycolate phosphatase-like HAD superfamily hydrolase
VTPGLLVLDFDGVVCDGMDEFFETSSRTLAELTGQPLPESRRAELRARFAALRPIVESGWEMAVLLGVLADGAPADDAALREPERWADARDAYLRTHALPRANVAAAFDDVRVRWIDRDLPDWLGHHRFYPGVAAWLTGLAAARFPVYVLSTKGKPFLDALLAAHGVPLPSERVIGKAEPRRDKWDVLRDLAAEHAVPIADLWFVEDRLPTLLDLRRRAPDLATARLFLADWGYVFPDQDTAAARAAGIPVLTLDRVTGPFPLW